MQMDISPTQPSGRGKNKRFWTKDEEIALVDALVTLSVDPCWKGEGGFKNGFLVQLAEMVEKKCPGCGLKAMPHIESKVKWFKDKYSVINEMLFRRSGFKWDDEKNIIICEKQAYTDFCKQFPKAKGLWKYSFPYLDKLDLVFGIDRANVIRCELPDESIKLLGNEIVKLGEEECQDNSMDKEKETPTPIEDLSPQASSSKKTRKEEKDDRKDGKKKKARTTSIESDFSFTNNISSEYSGLMKVMNTHLATIVNVMTTMQEHEKLLMSREKEVMDRKKNLVNDVLEIPGLVRSQVIKITRLLSSSPSDLDVFYSSPTMEWKRDFVLELLGSQL